MKAPIAVAVALVAVACSTPAVPEPSTTVTSTVPTTSTAPTTTTRPPTTTTTTTTLPAGAPGTEGIGDTLYPELGNGGYDATHYDLDLVVDPATGAIEALARITATATQHLSAFNLDLVGLDVTAVSVDGAPAQFERDERELTVVPDDVLSEGTEFEVEIAYGGVPSPTATTVPFGSGWQTVGDLIYVISEPDGAASWFPVNDHPRDPATFRITIDPGPGYETVTSGVAVSGLDDPAEPDVWEILEPTAPYLVAFAVGEFERLEQEPFGDVELVVWYPPGLPEALLEPFEAHADMLEFYSGLFGPYPFDRFGGLILNDPNLAAALETQTLVTYGLPALGLGEAVVAHELVHQWFGNAVPVDEWRHIWLNEGLATFGEWLWAEEAFGRAAYDQQVVAAYRLMSGAALESGPAEADRRFPPPADPAPDDLFNPSVYLRGGLALVALRDEIGDEAMWGLLAEWAARQSGQGATTEDFLDLVAEIAGSAAAEVLEEQLFEELPPAMPERGLSPP